MHAAMRKRGMNRIHKMAGDGFTALCVERNSKLDPVDQ